MKITSHSLTEGQPVPERNAFGVPDPQTRMRLGDNLSPHIAWSGVPDGTRSLVLLCHDPDAPGEADDVNKADRELPADVPRIDFFHWVLVDIPPDWGELGEGTFSSGVTPKGKSGPEAPQGLRQGLNDFTGFLAGDPEMAGEYFGYDGPCPPWNDPQRHHYVFTLYATDLPRCPVDGAFTGGDVRTILQGHVLDRAALTATYSLNPDMGR